MAESPDQPFLPPVPTREWDPAMFTALGQLKPPEGSSYEKRRTERAEGGARAGSAVFNVLAHNPDLAQGFFAFNRHLLYTSTLSERVRELVILRVAYLSRCSYEWAQHVLAAATIGMEDAEVQRVPAGPDADGWSADDATLLRAVDELLADATIGAATWGRLTEMFEPAQLVDLVFTIGAYQMLAYAFTTFGVELEPDLLAHPLPPLPDPSA